MTDLTAERLREYLEYNCLTGVFRWRGSGCVTGTKTKAGYIRVRIDEVRYYAHRLAWLYVHGEWPPEEIDHINQVKTDNRLCNLRLASHAENTKNKPIPRTNRTGVRGVSKSGERFVARIMVDGVQKHLGRFDTPEEAGEAYHAAAVEGFGTFCP